MCSDRDPGPGAFSPDAFMRNWRDSDLPFWQRLRVAWHNEWIKVRTRQTCCGNYGEPGC
jgi:hypothetical protein